MLQALKRLPDTHLQYTLLRYCFDSCRINHLLRATQFAHAEAGAKVASRLLRNALDNILGPSPMTDNQWMQATLPIRCGGLGISDPVRVHALARIACIVDFSQRATVTLGLPAGACEVSNDCRTVLLALQPHVPPLPELIALCLTETIPLGALIALDRPQEYWTTQATKTWVQSQSTLGTARDRVRFEAQQSPHSGSWLAALPSAANKTRVPSEHWRLLLRWTLGMPVVPDEVIGAPCVRCDQPVDAWGDHSVSCIKNEIQRRHMALQAALAGLIQQAGLTCALERGTGDGRRPADVFIPRWDADGPTAVDLTVRCPSAPGNPVRDPAALDKWRVSQEREKTTMYEETCMRARWAFVPLLMDTHGGMGSEAKRFLSQLLPKLLACNFGRTRRTLEAEFWKKLTFPVMAVIGRQLYSLKLSAPVDRMATGVHNPYSS